MVTSSRQIVNEVNNTTHLDEALSLVVKHSRSFMGADACSVYICDKQNGRFNLMAFDGAMSDAIGNTQVGSNEGLVGWVAAHEEVINLSNAADHPGFQGISNINDGPFYGFMGVPIIQHGRAVGVLAAQRFERRSFSDDDVAFFSTLAFQLGEAIHHLLAKWELSRRLSEPSRGRMRILGIPCAPGLSTGNIVLSQPADLQSTPDRIAQDIQSELNAFQAALIAAKNELHAGKERMRIHLADEALSLFDAYMMMLESDKLTSGATARIRNGQWARGALRDTISEMAQVFEKMENPYLAARAEDIRTIGQQVLVHLQQAAPGSRTYPKQCILAGWEVSLAEISNVPRDQLAGIVSVKGSPLSHTAIICRAIGIPAVMCLTDLVIANFEGCEITLDGFQGAVCINPSPEDIEAFRQLIQEEQAIAAQLETLRQLPAQTLDGAPIPMHVNLGVDADDLSMNAKEYEGVGLYRTEFFFIARDTLPTEEEQYRLYRDLLQFFAPKPVTIRTLDAGGDKKLPFFTIAETNPFLGRRGIRFTLDHTEIFLTQLRALLRANAGIGNLQILFPMISRIYEIDAALGLLDRAYSDLTEEGRAAAKPQIGAMIEVPSAVYVIAELARRVDFFSIGTNDLTQFLLAMDRSNPWGQGFNDNLHPSVVHVVDDIVQRAHRKNKPVGVCGEMAGDPASALLLIGLGVDSLSMTPSSLPRIKWTIRNFTMQQARGLADSALKIDNEADTQRLLNHALNTAGLSVLVRET
ncbi:phosphoenolpyruvate--protein phosphotransferase [Desulfatibacillum aliphaticivorans]|uniref:phosphoenolpyruvate--protein phosphotransferase n=1 Tax=Desulfatibacillum aliphaticivorans TaxID=218208 RepID=UPI0004093B4A|nr:phosphoenolpyruvate--protein phosphotransferase [Desulfatibacillum aliphaticivorans]